MSKDGDNNNSDLDLCSVGKNPTATETYAESHEGFCQRVQPEVLGRVGILAQADGKAEQRRLHVAPKQGDEDDREQHQIGLYAADLQMADPRGLQDEDQR